MKQTSIGLLTLFLCFSFAIAEEVVEEEVVEEEVVEEEVDEMAPESCIAPGRYQVITHPTVRADQYLLDTCLGRIWQQVTYTDLGKTVWVRVDRADSEEELTLLLLVEALMQNAESDE